MLHFHRALSCCTLQVVTSLRLQLHLTLQVVIYINIHVDLLSAQSKLHAHRPVPVASWRACSSLVKMSSCSCQHVCGCTCVHVCAYACMHACMYVYVCMHVCRAACMHVCLYACMHVCMHACKPSQTGHNILSLYREPFNAKLHWLQQAWVLGPQRPGPSRRLLGRLVPAWADEALKSSRKAYYKLQGFVSEC